MPTIVVRHKVGDMHTVIDPIIMSMEVTL